MDCQRKGWHSTYKCSSLSEQKYFEEEEWVDLWKEICKEETDNHLEGKRQAKGGEVWKEADPEQDTMESLFENWDRLYKDAKEYEGWSLGV